MYNRGDTIDLMKLAKTYNHQEFESDIYSLWERAEAFAPSGEGEPFSIVLPPPNANAGLHIGHALMFNIQDVIVRYQRMAGRDVLWLPGADHAGFETQVVYEKHLAKEGKSRFDFSREELYAQIFDFVSKNRTNFDDMFRRLGASVDWKHFTFTLDQNVIDTSYKTFKKLWDDGLIYRGERLVNYCTQHRTGFADIEVAYEEQKTPLYYMKYGPFELATTRPETKFGDTAIAVHPDDERYKEYIGKTLEVEGVHGPFELRVVADDMVDREFGTGVVKITPAHDFNDWEVAQRHNLQAKRVINHDGTMNHLAGEFEGMPVLEARTAVVKALKDKGLLLKVDDTYKNRVAKCYKCGTTIEPMLMEQWFINMQELAKQAIKALEDKKVTFYPSAKRLQTIDYLKNVKDWNISRQIAWGIPIPAFQNVDDSDDWIFNEQVDKHTIEINGKTYRRDPDVFDTWFSSGHWPYVTLDGPDSDDFKHYYPNALMETGGDILYPWVSRMLVLGVYLTNEVPFKEVYLHGMVRGEDGKKMSKSIGNVVDPYPLLDEYGSDAVRMGMITGRSAGESAAYAPAKIIAGRNFANKLWNVARFVEGVLEDTPGKAGTKTITPADHWMLRELQQTIKLLTLQLEEYRLSEAFETMYHFVWDTFADWYVESSKHEINPELLRFSLQSVLKISHPFAPFVSETIWQTLNTSQDSLLISQAWPKAEKYDDKQAAIFDEIKTIVSEIRLIKASLQLKKASLYFTDVTFLKDHGALIAGLAGLDGVHEVEAGQGLHLTQTTHNCWLDVDRETMEHYSKKLQKQLEEAQNKRDGYAKRLENETYVKQAPKKLVDETKNLLAETKLLIENIEKELTRFTS
jgi:valyl-tRNA synthetase